MHKPQRQRLFFIKCPFNFVAEDICITKIFPEILFATLWDRPILLWINHLGYPVNLVLSNKVHCNEKNVTLIKELEEKVKLLSNEVEDSKAMISNEIRKNEEKQEKIENLDSRVIKI